MLAAAMLLGITFGAQAQETETRSLGSFSGVHAAEGIEVTLVKGSSNSAEVTAHNVDMDEVLTEIKNGNLKVHFDDGNHRNARVSVVVTYSGTLRAFSASSAGSLESKQTISGGDMHVDVSSAGSIKLSLEAEDLDVDASSAGHVELMIQAGDVDVDVSSSGQVELSGKAGDLDIEGSSSGDVHAYELEARNVDADMSSGAAAEVTLSGRLDGECSSGSSIRYRGNPSDIDVETSSGGSCRKG